MQPGPETQCRCAMVFAHPGHELLVTGLIQRHRPHLLFLTRADSAGDQEREALSKHGLEQLGIADRATFLSVGESDLYRWLLDGDIEPLLQLRTRVAEWLDAIQPTALFGDAFELSNIVHDTGRALLDSAWRESQLRFSCDNFELPLVCRTEPGLWNLRLQEFPNGPFEICRLTEAEVEMKRALADWVGTQRVEAAMARDLFSPEREVFRQVSPERDYTKPPEGLLLHYDEWGRVQVQIGKYAKAISFAEHFVPLVQQLPWLQPVPASATRSREPGGDMPPTYSGDAA